MGLAYLKHLPTDKLLEQQQLKCSGRKTIFTPYREEYHISSSRDSGTVDIIFLLSRSLIISGKSEPSFLESYILGVKSRVLLLLSFVQRDANPALHVVSHGLESGIDTTTSGLNPEYFT